MAVFKKILLIVIILLTCSIVLGGCKQNNPEIITSITLSDITEDEYSRIYEPSKPEGVTINDLKKLYIDVKISNSKKAKERAITISDLFIIDRYDRVRTTGGGSSEQNNIGTEDTAESFAYIIFDSRGLSEQDLRSLYSESKIYVAYKLKNSNLVEKSISIGDNLTINN
jgi:hypothetical protein